MPNRAGAGLIPAHAGKTVSTTVCSKSGRAHPRSRGENGSRVRPLPCVPGSSPLTRGKLLTGRENCALCGLIPAHAGKTRGLAGRRTSQGAHPRSRGENSGPSSFCQSAWGSSPLTRGKHDDGVAPRARVGLIPAHAGKTKCGHVAFCTYRAHPRSRGENNKSQIGSHAPLGSSPLTRGKLP